MLVGVPGYVLPTDQTGRLFVHAPSAIQSVTVEPTGALVFTPDPKPTAHGWRAYTVHGKTPGRCRVVIAYAGGLTAVRPVLRHPARSRPRSSAWARSTPKSSGSTTPTTRSGAPTRSCRTTALHNKLITQHPNAWFVGLSDEIGAGASVAMAMKNLGLPDKHQIALLEQYANTALWGHLQNPDYSVRAGLFYYGLPGYPYQFHGSGWGFWDKARTETTWRAYNYPHVTAVYCALYHLARDHQGLVTERPWCVLSGPRLPHGARHQEVRVGSGETWPSSA